ncbi:hypothetical protein ABEB36_015434 [Hypothenemus hampei]|uniref:Uncharacterized protein n=1 Tax=Hypothenemus hampei TaxID=57062 RepID=A0ABD1E4U4_HYPHA
MSKRCFLLCNTFCDVKQPFQLCKVVNCIFNKYYYMAFLNLNFFTIKNQLSEQEQFHCVYAYLQRLKDRVFTPICYIFCEVNCVNTKELERPVQYNNSNISMIK